MNKHIGSDFDDFLAREGLDVEVDACRQLISQKIELSDLPEEERRPLLQAVRELPGDAIKHLTTRLLDLGMDNLPGAIALIRASLPSSS